MEKPEVKIIQSQEEQATSPNIDNWEAEQLLRKYGYNSSQYSPPEKEIATNPDSNLTFEELVAKHEAKLREERLRKEQLQNGPRPTTFDPNRGYDSEVKYSSDEDSGFSFRIEITSDMKIPKY
jgi:hypothetical protein